MSQSKSDDPTYDYENDTNLCSLCHHNVTFFMGLCEDCFKKNDSTIGAPIKKLFTKYSFAKNEVLAEKVSLILRTRSIADPELFLSLIENTYLSGQVDGIKEASAMVRSNAPQSTAPAPPGEKPPK